MKLNELISNFEIFITNEEKTLLTKMEKYNFLESFNEREQFIIDNLVKKSIISKVIYQGKTLVMKNEY